MPDTTARICSVARQVVKLQRRMAARRKRGLDGKGAKRAIIKVFAMRVIFGHCPKGQVPHFTIVRSGDRGERHASYASRRKSRVEWVQPRSIAVGKVSQCNLAVRNRCSHGAMKRCMPASASSCRLLNLVHKTAGTPSAQRMVAGLLCLPCQPAMHRPARLTCRLSPIILLRVSYAVRHRRPVMFVIVSTFLGISSAPA